MRSILKLALLLMLPMALVHCMSPGADSRLRQIEARQDSILKVLGQIQEKGDFVAARAGWRPPPDTTPKVLPIGGSYSHGPENAQFTLVEFSDLECPYCAQLSPIIDSLMKVYPKDVRVVYKHFPLSFHQKARAAAAASIAAGKQGKFFEFKSKVAPRFASLSDTLYLAVAKEIGLDMERFKKEMILTPEVNAILDADIELGKKVGVGGTPTLFVNGRLASDRSFEYFASLIKPTP